MIPGGTGGRIVVTGAAGFLGAHVVRAAREAGFSATPVARTPRDGDQGGHADGETVALDLAAPGGDRAFARICEGAQAVIHAAAGAGDDAAHARDTLAATEAAISGVLAGAPDARFVLVSSLSVYNFASMPDWTRLDETCPREPDLHLRDAYCRAKVAQEHRVIEAAQRRGLQARILRPGAIFGPGRLGTPRLGVALGPVLLRPDPRTPVPAISAEDCARALVRAAHMPIPASDLPILDGDGAVDFVNVVHDAPPTVETYLAELQATGWPRRVAAAPMRLMRLCAKAVSLSAALTPGIATRLPGLLRAETLEARFKPLRYSAARLRERLDFAPSAPFVDQIRADIAAAPRTGP